MKRIRLLGITLGLGMVFLLPSGARAQFFFVDCSGTNPYAYPSINSVLPFSGPGSFIAVVGTCNESVSLYGFNNLHLGAFFGQTANLNGNLNINNSENVYVYGLNVSNSSGDGIEVNSSHSVVLDSCTSNGNAGNGLSLSQSSDVTINAMGGFSGNGGDGILAGNNSLVSIVSWAGTTEISNNRNSAIGVFSGNFATLGNTHMANNGSNSVAAIDMRGAGKAQMGSAFSPNIIENNLNGGVSLQENAEISFWSIPPSGPNIVRNNGAFGVEAGFGSQVTLVGAQIAGHSGPGVDIYAHSQLYGSSQLLGPTQIQNNGTVGDPLSAGIRVDGNSEALLRGIDVSGNHGPAILALVNSSADFAGGTFSGNTGVITCDSSSTMVSDLGIAARTPAAGVSCATSHTLGNRVANVPTPAVPEVTAWKKMHANYQQRSAAQK